MSQVAATKTPMRRRLAGWAAVAAALVLVGLAGTLLSGLGEWSERDALDPESAGPEGARALARVLAEQGVEVTVARDRTTARDALDAADGDAALVLPDAPALSDDTLRDLADAADAVVLIEPRSHTLHLLMAGSDVAGAASDEPIAPACDLPAARDAGEIVAGSLYLPGDGIEACYPADGAYALLQADRGGRTVTAIDGRALLANDAVDRAGNAALALGLLGAQPALIWYAPSLADADAANAPTLGELTPPWVTPAMALLIAAAVVAAVWRGRRFGPLVAENLPVTVRAAETAEGRARLYARSGDAAHAIDQLRRPARDRIARLLGLTGHATTGAIADAAASRLGIDRARVRGILEDEIPANDRALVDLDHRLRDLEARVRAASRPEGTTR